MPDRKSSQRFIQMIRVVFLYLYVYFEVGRVQCGFLVERQIERDAVPYPQNPC